MKRMVCLALISVVTCVLLSGNAHAKGIMGEGFVYAAAAQHHIDGVDEVGTGFGAGLNIPLMDNFDIFLEGTQTKITSSMQLFFFEMKEEVDITNYSMDFVFHFSPGSGIDPYVAPGVGKGTIESTESFFGMPMSTSIDYTSYGAEVGIEIALGESAGLQLGVNYWDSSDWVEGVVGGSLSLMYWMGESVGLYLGGDVDENGNTALAGLALGF